MPEAADSVATFNGIIYDGYEFIMYHDGHEMLRCGEIVSGDTHDGNPYHHMKSH